MIAFLHERIYLLMGLLIGVPGTFYFLVVPLWRAHRNQRRLAQCSHSSAVRRASPFSAFVLGSLNGCIFFPFVAEELLLSIFAGLFVTVITLAWCMLLSGGAFRFGSFHPFFGFGRPVPEKMANPIQAPIVLPLLLFFAGVLVGFVIHMLFAIKA